MAKIRWKKGYKFQVFGDYQFELPEEFPEIIYAGRFLRVAGRLVTIKDGYAGDGPSGPTIDTNTFMRGAWQHDATYQLFRAGIYDISLRPAADRQLINTCKEDGMTWIRRQWVYAGVKYGAAKAARASSLKRIHEAGKEQ